MLPDLAYHCIGSYIFWFGSGSVSSLDGCHCCVAQVYVPG